MRSAPSKTPHQVCEAARACSAIRREQTRLEQLHVPVAVLAPEEVIDHVRGFVEAILSQRRGDLRRPRD